MCRGELICKVWPLFPAVELPGSGYYLSIDAKANITFFFLPFCENNITFFIIRAVYICYKKLGIKDKWGKKKEGIKQNSIPLKLQFFHPG